MGGDEQSRAELRAGLVSIRCGIMWIEIPWNRLHCHLIYFAKAVFVVSDIWLLYFAPPSLSFSSPTLQCVWLVFKFSLIRSMKFYLLFSSPHVYTVAFTEHIFRCKSEKHSPKQFSTYAIKLVEQNIWLVCCVYEIVS